MARTALYAGSFDPITNGHIDVIRGACRMADRIVLAIGTHPGKQPLFTVEERLEMLRQVTGPVAKKEKVEIEAVTFNGLVIAAARRAGATLLVRGLRNATDFDYEMQMAGMNAEMSPKIQTVFLPASTGTRPITATLVRQIASMGGDVSAFVPAPVAKRLRDRFARKA